MEQSNPVALRYRIDRKILIGLAKRKSVQLPLNQLVIPQPVVKEGLLEFIWDHTGSEQDRTPIDAFVFPSLKHPSQMLNVLQHYIDGIDFRDYNSFGTASLIVFNQGDLFDKIRESLKLPQGYSYSGERRWFVVDTIEANYSDQRRNTRLGDRIIDAPDLFLHFDRNSGINPPILASKILPSIDFDTLYLDDRNTDE